MVRFMRTLIPAGSASIPATAHQEEVRPMEHAHDSSPAAFGDAAVRATSNEQPNARSGPTSPGNADVTRLYATTPSDARSGLTRQEQTDRWPLG